MALLVTHALALADINLSPDNKNHECTMKLYTRGIIILEELEDLFWNAVKSL